MGNNTLAVLLPVYTKDNPQYFAKSVDSILRQTFGEFTLYIGVDGPVTDELNETIKGFECDKRVHPVWFKENRGLAIVLNDLIDIATRDGAELFARMDADDISMPDRFEKQLKFLKDNLDIDVVGGAISEIDEEGKSRDKTVVYPQTPEACRAFFAKRDPHAHPAVMLKKSFFEKIGHCYRPEYRKNQDTMLWLDGFANNTRNANIQDVVLKFRMTDSLFNGRRNGWKFAKSQLKNRLLINRTLKYGIKGRFFAYAMFMVHISPTWLRKLAYKYLR